MNSRMKRRNDYWFKLSGDHVEFNSTYTDLALQMMYEYHNPKLTEKSHPQKNKEIPLELSKEEKLEKIPYLPHKEKIPTDKELKRYKNTICGIKCLIQNYTTPEPKHDTDIRINIFLNRKEETIYNDETADIVRYAPETLLHYRADGKRSKHGDLYTGISYINHLISVMYPKEYHHLARSLNDKPVLIHTNEQLPKESSWFTKATIDKYNTIALLKNQMLNNIQSAA